MFDQRYKGKIKNDKIMRWRLELSCFSFDIVYRPGKDNISPDALSRATCAAATDESLYKLHESLCHPGVTRLNHFVRTKNLLYSLEEIKKTTSQCPVCCECKPRYHHPEKVPLIKATQPFERINIDFKGPLPSNNGNKFFLHVIDEYSRFPFVFLCPDVSITTIIKCLTSLFSIFGMPAYVHSDRGTSFMTRELQVFLRAKGVPTSRTTSYNPEGNGQVERYNRVIWKALTMCLKSMNLPVTRWQDVLPDVLHSARSLLCTGTNGTPHERFFGFPRRSSSGAFIPTWLATPGPVLKRQVRSSKTDPLVDEVELLEANPNYAHVRYPDGRETTVSIKHLAPKGQSMMSQPTPEVSVEEEHLAPDRASMSQPTSEVSVEEENLAPDRASMSQPSSQPVEEHPTTLTPVEQPPLCRSERIRRPPDRLNL